MIRWGSGGLAFRTTTDIVGTGPEQVIIFHGPFVLPRSQAANPAPALTSASPASVTAHTDNTWVTLTGTGSVPGSVATWNGANRTTNFISATQLQVAIPTADLTTAGAQSLRVVNPAPGGRTSTALTFIIN